MESPLAVGINGTLLSPTKYQKPISLQGVPKSEDIRL